jgi:hypothetical protein
VAGFAVHHSIDCNIKFRMRAIRMGMDHIENEALGRYLILTDSMSSIRVMRSRKISLHTHTLVHECKQKCWQLTRNGSELSFMWAHVGIAWSERADFEARQSILGNMVHNTQSLARDLLPIAKQRILDEWVVEKLGSRWNRKASTLHFSQVLS